MTRTKHALVVLADGPRTEGVFVPAETCLNHVAQLATFVGKDIRIAMTFELSEAKWEGRGRR